MDTKHPGMPHISTEAPDQTESMPGLSNPRLPPVAEPQSVLSPQGLTRSRGTRRAREASSESDSEESNEKAMKRLLTQKGQCLATIQKLQHEMALVEARIEERKAVKLERQQKRQRFSREEPR